MSRKETELMDFTVNVEHQHGVAIVHGRGRITLGEGSRVLSKTIRDLIASGNTRIILELRHVRYLDSAGLCSIVSGFVSVANAGGDTVLACLSPVLRDILRITRTGAVFKVFDSVEDALQHFRKSGGPGQAEDGNKPDAAE